jgi:SAM-dependent methyltransferase
MRAATLLLGPRSADLVAIARSGNIRFANAAARIPCAKGTARAVYSSHMIEHLDRDEARAFLAEVRRILRPGGIVRLAAPDLSRLIAGYVATGNADGFVAGTHMGLDRPAGLRARARWALVGPRHHLWMYDGESLLQLLAEAGFADGVILPPGSTKIAAPGQLDLHERATESVYAEAVRPLHERRPRAAQHRHGSRQVCLAAPRELPAARPRPAARRPLPGAGPVAPPPGDRAAGGAVPALGRPAPHRRLDGAVRQPA